MVSRFEDLPNEVQELVFKQFRFERSNLIQCMLVCKSWKILFQNPLYKDISFNEISKVKRFVAAIEKRKDIRSLVKMLNFCVSKRHSHNVLQPILVKLFLFLPNVERIDMFFQSYYWFILNALRLGQLPKLKYLHPPSYQPPVYMREIEAYFNCAYLLKGRLENLAIVDWDGTRRSADMWSDDDSSEDNDDIFDEQITSVRGDFLFQNLRQFKKIQELEVKRNCVNKFELIEKISRDSTTIQKLILEFNTDYHSRNSDSPPLHVIPATHVKNLKYSGTVLGDMKLLNYVMDKFPGLDTLEISDRTKPWHCMEKSMFSKLLSYFYKIRKVSTSNIHCKEEIMLETIAPFWSTVSQTHLLAFELAYPGNAFSENTLDVKIENGVFTNKFYFPSDPATTGLKIVSYIEQFGQYINHLSLSDLRWNLSDSSYTRKTPFELLVLHPLKYCDKLTQLSLLDCHLEGLSVTGYKAYKKQTFDTLRLTDCKMEKDVFFKAISPLFGSIKNLILWTSMQWGAPENDSITSVNINMMETDIGKLAITDFRGSGEALLLINLLQGGNRTYHMYDLSTHEGEFMEFETLKTISNREYNKKLRLRKSVTIDISCKSLQILEIEYAQKCVKLVTFRP